MTPRPVVALSGDPGPLLALVDELQAGADALDAVRFNAPCAADVLWGSPFGAIVEGYEALHAIHTKMFAAASRERHSHYEVEHVRFLADDVAVAYVRRTSTGDSAAETFDELALFVFVRRDGGWWLAAGQHTPDRRDVYS
jgi:uncharacterized protein (TIGR02246 family)